MNKELLKRITDIEENTGVKLSIIKKNKVVYGDENLSLSIMQITEPIFLNGKCYFSFFQNSEKYVACFSSNENSYKEYAFFVKTILENNDEKEKDNVLLKILTGRALSKEYDEYLKNNPVPKGESVVYLFDVKARLKEAVELFKECEMTDYRMIVDEKKHQIIIIKFFFNESEEDDIKSYKEFGEMLTAMLKNELGLQVFTAVGVPVTDFANIKVSYEVAVEIKNISERYNLNSYILTGNDILLIRLLEQVAKSDMDKLQYSGLDENFKAVLDDDSLTETADEFMFNNLNVSETARQMFMHRNTLIYRLDKIERGTGLNIRNFNDALSFKIALTSYRLFK